MKKILAGIATLLMGFALAAPLGHAGPLPPPTWILVGGHGDPTGSGIDGELFRLGWLPKGKLNKVRIAYLADASRGEESTADATPKIVAAYNANCLTGAKCELHAVSGGGNAAIRASHQLGLPNANTKVVLHATPNTLTGVAQPELAELRRCLRSLQRLVHREGIPKAGNGTLVQPGRLRR